MPHPARQQPPWRRRLLKRETDATRTPARAVTCAVDARCVALQDVRACKGGGIVRIRQAGAVAVIAALVPLCLPAHGDVSDRWVSPAKASDQVIPVQSLSVGASGTAYAAPFGNPPMQMTFVPVTGASLTVKYAIAPELVGDWLLYTAYRDMRHLEGNNASATYLRNVKSGVTTMSHAPSITVNLGDGTLLGFVGIDADPCFCSPPTRFQVVRQQPDGSGQQVETTIDFHGQPPDSWTHSGNTISFMAEGRGPRVWIYDIKSRQLSSVPHTEDTEHASVTDNFVVWSTSDKVVRRSRLTGNETSSPAPCGAPYLAATDAMIALRCPDGLYLDRLGVRTKVAIPPTGVMSTYGGDIYTAAWTDEADSGVYRIDSTGGVTRMFPLAAMPYAATPIGLTGNRIYYSDNSAKPQSAQWERPLSDTQVSTVVGGELSSGLHAGRWTSISGSRVAQQWWTRAAGWHIVVTQGGRVTRTVSTKYVPLSQLSGARLLVLDQIGRAAAFVVDLQTGTRTTVPAARAAVWGPYVYYLTNNGVWRRDLRKPSSARPEHVNACTSRGLSNWLTAWGDWVACRGAASWTLELANLRTGTVQEVRGDEPMLVDGALVYTGPADPWPVLMMDLRSAQHSVQRLVPYYALRVADEHLLAYRGSDGLLHIARLPVDTTTTPTAIYVQPPTHVHPGATTSIEVDSTKPLQHWIATLVDSSGRVRRSWAGTAPDGTVRFSWDGKLLNAAASSGRYTLTVTGTATDGSGTLTSVGSGSPKVPLTVR
jgi:hypothetical protein